jgi:hypothetical protein
MVATPRNEVAAGRLGHHSSGLGNKPGEPCPGDRASRGLLGARPTTATASVKGVLLAVLAQDIPWAANVLLGCSSELTTRDPKNSSRKISERPLLFRACSCDHWAA